jgi:Rps23 Pro-64 3,4-dihydroxylase Tpa1-like proline 4-hydroxylase
LSKVLVIEDFLDIDHAKKVAEIIKNDKEWIHVYKSNQEHNPVQLSHSFTDKKERIKQQGFLQNSLIENEFTFRQKRMSRHPDTCRCAYCSLIYDTLLSPDFVQYVEALSGLQDLDLISHFASIYAVGDFLSIHKDPKYDVAYILNLSEDWKYEYGGCLTVFEDERPTVLLPKFNSLVLIFLQPDGVEHYVSEVSQLAPGPRLAVSGWYNRKSS